MHQTRRALLRSALAATLVLVWPRASGDSAGARLGDPELGPRLARLLGGSNGARRIGRRYLERFPTECDRRALLREVGVAAASAPGRGFESRLRARIRGDFRRGDTVALDGWVLSRTELRLCAIVSLSDQTSAA